MSPAGFPGEDEPDPPPPKFKIEVGRPLVPFAQPLLHEATMEQINAELTRRSPPGELRGLLANVPIEAINAELTRRFQGVALVGVQVGPDGAVRDLYYTSVRGLPLPALAGCVHKLAADLQSQSSRVDIKPT